MTLEQKRQFVMQEIADKGYTAYQLGKSIRVSDVGLAKILSGKTLKPRSETIIKLYEFLKANQVDENSLAVHADNKLGHAAYLLKLEKKNEALEVDNDLMSSICTNVGFFQAYFNALPFSNSTEEAFHKVNDYHFKLWGVYRYESYEDFRGGWLSLGYTVKNTVKPVQRPTTLSTEAFKKLEAPQRRFASMRRAVDLVERFYAAGYDDDFKIQNAVLAVHPDAHPVNILCYCDLNFVSWELADVMENALNVLKPGA
jgi:transcriptional regulator with XRE-family HTH domain